MSVEFFAEGPVAAEFLTCSRQCDSDLDCEICPNEQKEVKLLSTVIFHLPEKQILTIQPGFVFDGASIPKICWTSIGHPLEHRFIYAALLHDALYSVQILPRDLADKYFYDFLKAFAGVGWFTAWKMYSGVRLFGNSAWEKKTKTQIAQTQKLVHLTGETV